jgi:hypothetical protein
MWVKAQLRRRRADRGTVTLRRFVPTRPDRVGRHDPEALVQLHTTLVLERQQLRLGGAPAEELERNRLAIVQCQWELSQALIDRHAPPAAAPSAA